MTKIHLQVMVNIKLSKIVKSDSYSADIEATLPNAKQCNIKQVNELVCDYMYIHMYLINFYVAI